MQPYFFIQHIIISKASVIKGDVWNRFPSGWFPACPLHFHPRKLNAKLMVASVKIPLISVDFGSALKDMRTDTENLGFWSSEQHCHYLTQHSETSTQQSSFPRPSCCDPHSCSILSAQPVWHRVMAVIVTWMCDMGNGSQTYTVGDYRSKFTVQVLWLRMGNLLFSWTFPVFATVTPPQLHHSRSQQG